MRDVADRFIEGVVAGREGAAGWATRWSWNTEIGPMVSKEQFELVSELVDDAVANGAEAALRRARRGATAPRRLLRPDRADRRDARHADHARGDLRPGGADRDGRVRGGGDRAGERLRVRAGRLGVDARPRQGRADRAPDRVRHGLDQRPHVLARRMPVRLGRRQGLRPRPLALEVRLLRVREHQAARLGAVAHAQLLVAPLRRVARQGDRRLRAAALRPRRRQAQGTARGRWPADEVGGQDPCATFSCR